MAQVKSGVVILVFCWAHVRRDFIAVGKGWPELTDWAITWLRRIRDLYHLNRQRLSQESEASEDGYDLLPLLLGKTYRNPLREATVHHSVNGMFAIRKGDWKLIEGGTDGDFRRGNNAAAQAATLPERDSATGKFKPFAYDILDFDPQNPVCRLYNLADDPAETTDVAAKHPEKVAELCRLLDRYRTSGRSTPTPDRSDLVPRITGSYIHVYRPEPDVFPGPDTARLKAGQRCDDWQPNDHAIIKGPDNRWHAFGITHPNLPGPPWHEGEFQAFHAASPPGDLRDNLREHAWQDLPKILSPKDRPGERLEFYAPYIVSSGEEYWMFYSPSPIRYATSPDLVKWTPKGKLFDQEGAGRDPSIFYHDGKYYMLLTSGTGVVVRTSVDLLTWSEPTTICLLPDGQKGGAESPTMIRQGDAFYLFWCRWDPKIDDAYQHITSVFRSKDPLDFRNRRPLARLKAHAPEIFQDEHGDWYISSVEWPRRGLSIAPLSWEQKR